MKKTKTSYNLGIIFNLDGRYVWQLVDFDLNGPTYRSSGSYMREEEAKSAGYDFAAKHNLAVKNVYYQ